LAAHGATIILLGKTVNKLENLYDEIEKNGGPQPAIMPMDLESADETAYENLSEAIYDNFGQLDGLILNAATLGQHSPIVHIDFEQWTRSLTVNLTANFLFLKHCSGLLNQAGRASVIYVSDQLALHGKAYWGTYATCKAAGLNLMQTVADEWDANTQIHLNSIDPGPMSTAFRRQAFPGEDPDAQPQPETVTSAFLYLMDPGENWPNGKHFQWISAAQTLTEI
ncbi:MAG: SDR family NAD(P)-dependent oxidoreductase, partial [Thioalkalispiraceae bacterium]|jgi:NAD(P)-dependent dehydrogenase (short-subunit alcohol dehydrogenase family)